MSNTITRIKQYIDYKGISIRKFEESVGFSNGAFASQYKNNKTIGVDKLENILQTYQDINIIWLLTGNGEMLINPSEKLENQEPPTKEDRLLALIESQQRTIEELSKKIK